MALTVVAGIGLATDAGGAAAAQTRLDGGTAPSTFGIGPSGPDAPDGRPYFNFLETPGATETDQVAVINVGDSPLTLDIYATDATNRADGSLDLLPAAEAPSDAGSWITLHLPGGGSTATIEPHGTLVIPITVAVPSGATPGDHVAGVVASLASVATSANGDEVQIDQRVAVRAFFRVAGELDPRLVIEHVRSHYVQNHNPTGRGSVVVDFTIRNDGNVKLGARPAVEVHGLVGPTQRVSTLADVPMLLPGASVEQHVRIRNVPPTVLGQVRIGVEPLTQAGDVNPDASVTHTADRVLTLPLTLTLVFLASLASGLALRWRRRRASRLVAAVVPA